jgi:DNA-binding NarL/FixJ family response regulator
LRLTPLVLVIHERIALWARQIRPRLADRPVRLIQTRSVSDLESVLAGSVSACPVVLIDLSGRVRNGLEGLDRALRVAPEALVLVLDPGQHEGVALLCREIGATHVIAGPVPPPDVAALLLRWLALATKRAEACGWWRPQPETLEPEPWNWLTPLLKTHP